MSETDWPLPLADFPDVSWGGQAPGYRCFRGNRVGGHLGGAQGAGWGERMSFRSQALANGAGWGSQGSARCGSGPGPEEPAICSALRDYFSVAAGAAPAWQVAGGSSMHTEGEGGGGRVRWASALAGVGGLTWWEGGSLGWPG